MNFATAMQEAAAVLSDLDAAHFAAEGEPSAEFEAGRLRAFLQTEEGARGFFVVLLTGEHHSADQLPPVLVSAVRESSAAAQTVLVKNLVMSAATQVLHNRNQDTQNAEGSRRVLSRVTSLFACTQSDTLRQQAQEMLDTIEGRSESFSAFLQRVKYDSEQKEAALAALSTVLSKDLA